MNQFSEGPGGQYPGGNPQYPAANTSFVNGNPPFPSSNPPYQNPFSQGPTDMGAQATPQSYTQTHTQTHHSLQNQAQAQTHTAPPALFPPRHVSNLTKTLIGSKRQEAPSGPEELVGQPPAYQPSSSPAAHVFGSHSFTPGGNYIPLGRNTPTAVSSSYTSNYSCTPSYHSAHGPGFLPGAPTATLSVSVHTPPSSYTRHSFSDRADARERTERFPERFPERLPDPGRERDSMSDRITGQPAPHPLVQSAPIQPAPIQPPTDAPGVSADHYMTYREYLASLPNGEAYEQHLNIVDFPVNDLITMLACLLSKIIEANDKLHPNHFENTIAVRQKLKERKRLKRERERRVSFTDGVSSGGVSTTIEHVDEDLSDDDSPGEEEDELKNRYLANVLAFHGTNVPGITLHAYLTRVLKYCPVTNEVFLSLLVYFDRIAKRVNNLKAEKKEGDTEQLFVMDSYNIHRLIISGITVSSKFFSDIFYKNLRYAKVGGLPLEELNYLELQFLLLLDFKLMISVEDLQNYGDLLLKFWKREQLTSELVGSKDEKDVN
ncbi:putative PHO85 cyclin protein [Clavispora lusitaniae]|uniref:PHO85 cyclin protein n=2 Tax=Clavispora lusitaniae TaxID=36911 RepID=C4XZP5_CLAL4|nr:uncharacterized protein CLUG_01427 [Clavispora lusitaniae ATCC 42720]KAF5212309.1 hypothetical protein E0198_001871 [Clavispora lusitaniae]EEQ37304.1 hypothetical protein CLUG_01427 [Clavispora lusitaniae ATCC 42720]QFZ26313.1 putative PHO85 cyclin protein [Clavispora lusitaniae]QFZ31981.1 putative PHO85 cyclin protein [Clavispora lusitaniae]QFZ37650.1 putative PHO85 cyclin protein [Clavispora lusitaniae]